MSVEACDLPRPYINDLEYYLEFGGTSPFVCAPGQLVELLESESPLAVHVSEGPEYFVASCEYALYASDITRTFPLSSEWPSKEAANIYKLVERMQESCIKRLAPGVRYLDLHILAHQIAIDGLLALGVYSAKEGVYKAGTSRAFHESMSTLNQTTVIRGASLENTAHGPSKGLRTIWTHTEPLRDNLETRLLPLFRSRAEAWQVYGSVLGQKPELRLVPQEDGFESNIEPTRNEYEGGRKGKRKYELECVERKSTEYMLANRYHGPSVCKDLRMPPPVVEYCLNRPKETDWLLIRSETLRWNTSVILDEVSSSTPFPDNAKLLVHGMRELGQLLLSLRLSPFMIRILPFFFFAHTHAQPSTARSSSSIEPDWRQRALGALTDNLVMFAFLLFPLVVLTITGCAANRFRRNSQEGKAALSMLGMAVIFIAIPAIPEGHNASKNDRYMRVAIGLSYAFFMTVYCMLIALRHRWYKGRCAIAGGLAILMTIVSMGSTSVQSYWTDSTKTDPIFALSIAIPTSFTLCDLVAYLSDAFKSPGGPGLPAPVPGPQQGA